MAKTAILSVRILGDAKGAINAMGGVEKKAGGLGGVMKGLGSAALGAATVAGGALIALGAAGVKGAGDLEQSMGAVDAVFKGSADEVHAYADAAATELGLTGNEYRELATLMGTQLKNGGTALDELGGKTHDLMGMGADMASMFGGTTADAVGAISSALKGERDPIEKFGVSLKQAGIDARAAEMGFTKVGGALTDEAQQAATLSLIMEQTADAHGNFAKETDTMAGQMQIATAQWGNFTTQIGMLLLPALTALLSFVTGTVMPGLQGLADTIGPHITAAIEQVGPVITGLLDNFTSLGSGSGVLQMILGSVTAAFSAIAPAVMSFLPALMSFGQSVIPVIIGAVQALIPVLMQIASVAIPAILGVVQKVLPIVQGVITTVVPAIIGAVQTLIPMILGMVPPIMSIVHSVIGVLGPAIQWLLPIVVGIFNAIVTQVQGAIQIITAVLTSVAALLRGDFSGAWEAIKGVVDGAITFVQGIIEQGMAIISGITGQSVEQIKQTFSDGWSLIVSTVSTKAGEMIEFVKGIPGKIMDGLGNLGDLLLGSGKALMDGFTQGIKNGVSNAIDAASGAVQSVRDFFPFSPAKRGPFSGSGYTDRSGKALVGDFAKAMTSEISTVSRAAGKVASAGTFEGGFALNGSGTRAGSGRAPVRIEVNFNGVVTDKVGTVRELRKLFREVELLEGTA